MPRNAPLNQAEINKFLAENPPDFPPDECMRRATEVIRRCCGKPPTFDLATGQPFEGDQLNEDELRRRGYLP